jgi:hypothetical protein
MSDLDKDLVDAAWSAQRNGNDLRVEDVLLES